MIQRNRDSYFLVNFCGEQLEKQRFAQANYIILSKTKNPINVIKFRFLLSEETYIVIWLEYNANLLSDF